jgi:hypothetical protein
MNVVTVNSCRYMLLLQRLQFKGGEGERQKEFTNN